MQHQFLKDKDIILFALKPWDTEIGSSSKQYARVFAKNNNRVLFVNRALDRFSLLRNKKDPKTQSRLQSIKGIEPALNQVEENIWVLNPPTILESINKISWPWLFDLFNKLNTRRLAKEIDKAGKQLHFNSPVLYIENDFLRGFYLKELLKNVSLSIYYIRDFLTSQDYFKTHGKRLEPALIKKADIVITNSVYLQDYARKYNARSYFVGQGCDLSLFNGEQFPVPADMQHISRPIIGYAGVVYTTRLDIAIIRKIALARKDCSIVLAGPEDKTFLSSDLHNIPNIFFLGRKKPEELPAYVSNFDICINPQLVNKMTIGNYPLKADEYLAMGKPMVATRTNGMEMFKSYACLCDTADDYIAAINSLLSEEQTVQVIEARKTFARSHTWDNCVYQLDGYLQANYGKVNEK